MTNVIKKHAHAYMRTEKGRVFYRKLSKRIFIDSMEAFFLAGILITTTLFMATGESLMLIPLACFVLMFSIRAYWTGTLISGYYAVTSECLIIMGKLIADNELDKYKYYSDLYDKGQHLKILKEAQRNE